MPTNNNANSNQKTSGQKETPQTGMISNYQVYQSAGGHRNFMASYGLKYGNDGDVEEARAIAEAMVAADVKYAAENKSKNGGK